MGLLDNLPHTLTHYRPSYTRDSYGGDLQADNELDDDVSAWVQNASMSEITEFQKRDQNITHKIYFTSDPGFRPGDVVVVTAGPSFVDDEFHFVAGTDRSAGLGVLFGGMFEKERNEPPTSFE